MNAKRQIVRNGLEITVLRQESEPGSRLRGGALESARIDTGSLAEGSGECKKFKSGTGKRKAIRKLEARSGIEPPMRVLQTLALPLGLRYVY